MFDTSYNFKYITSKKGEGELYDKLHIFGFSCKHNQRYIFLAEEHEHHVYSVKFYLKNHTDSDNRYKIITNFYDAPAILNTCFKILKHIVDYQNCYASFIFSGAPLLTEAENEETKRSRVYKAIVEAFFSPVNWIHYPIKNTYLLVNKKTKNSEELVNWVTEMLHKHYQF